MSLLNIILIIVAVAAAWGVFALVVGYLERGREQPEKDAEDHNGD